jgi:heterodisulfide reductase subunit C
VLNDISIWECTVCQVCTERCPRATNPGEIILAARRLQAADLGFPVTLMDVLMNIKKMGHAMGVEHAKKLRKKVGLEELPPTACKDPEAIKEISALLSKTKLAELGII